MAQHIPLLYTDNLDLFPEKMRQRIDSILKCRLSTIRGSLKYEPRPDNPNMFVTLRPVDRVGALLEIHISPQTQKIEQIYYVA